MAVSSTSLLVLHSDILRAMGELEAPPPQYQNQSLGQSQQLQNLRPGQMIVCDQYMRPIATPTFAATNRAARAKILQDDGEQFVDRIAFWAEMPLLGRIIAAKLCDRLDAISDKIAMLLPFSALP